MAEYKGGKGSPVAGRKRNSDMPDLDNTMMLNKEISRVTKRQNFDYCGNAMKYKCRLKKDMHVHVYDAIVFTHSSIIRLK